MLNEVLKTELQSIYEEKGRAAIFRSKCRWVEKGERPTKYFFNLEKRNYNRKTITVLRIEGETTTNNESQILEAIEKYYNELYASVNYTQEIDVDEFTEYLKIPKSTDTDRDRIEGSLSYEECKKALDTFQNNKAPGEDGFTVEFYMVFFFSICWTTTLLLVSMQPTMQMNSQRRWLAIRTIKLKTSNTT